MRSDRVFVPALVMVVLGCGREADSPTGPATSTPEPTQALAEAAAGAFYQVSAGEFHTCGVTTDYRAYCWGYNRNGQLGDRTTTDRLTPVRVAGTLQFRRVSTKGPHTCALTTDYRAYCWGSNFSGELGDGTTTQRLTPVPVRGGLQFRQLKAGELHTCGVRYSDRTAYCWGDNGKGELGDGTTTTRLKPVPVAGGRQFRQVSAGSYYTCAVTTSDEAYCWGDTFFGQLGDGTTTQHLTPVAVAGGLTFNPLSAGAWQTCVRAAAAAVGYCWGGNSLGQLGDGTTTDRLKPIPIVGPM